MKKLNGILTLALSGFLLVAQVMAQAPPGAAGASGGGGRARGGRGGGGAAGAAGASGAAAGRGGRGGRAGGFTQYTRPLAPQDVLARGKSLYEGNCGSCHSNDLRGVIGKGPNVLQQTSSYLDQHGELLIPELASHKPPITMTLTDTEPISEYIHSIQATMGGQGSPPGRNPVGLVLNVLVGDPAAGKTYFNGHCASCHSITGDLQGIGGKYADDPRGLQGAWVSGSAAGGGGRGGGGGGRGGGGRGGQQATITLAGGTKVQGTVSRDTDFLVVYTTADGERHDVAKVNGFPKVDIPDPQAAHKKMVLEMDDPDNKNLHDVTAYLATLK